MGGVDDQMTQPGLQVDLDELVIDLAPLRFGRQPLG